MVDDEYPPATLELPQWNLRAEFWIEGAGDEYGADTTDAGTYLYVATDQVRFYAIDAPANSAHAGGGGYTTAYDWQRRQRPVEHEPLLLEQIPPLVFSEVMRDVDLFVGVASVSNDPLGMMAVTSGAIMTTGARTVLGNSQRQLRHASRC